MAEFKSYLVSYRLDGAQWNIELPATSRQDAERRLRQLHYATVEGEVAARIPASVGFLAPLFAWLRNTLRI